MNVCVYGGGNVAHSIAAKISLSQKVTVITRQPERWMRRMRFEQNENLFESRFDVKATKDIGVAAAADVIFVALPQFAIQESIDRLSRVLKRASTVVLVPAPAIAADIMCGLSAIGVNVIGIQRVPYISRIVEYGSYVKISPDRVVHRMAFSAYSRMRPLISELLHWFGGEIASLSSFLTFAFNNSNPLLHPSRLCVLLEKPVHERMPLFYEEWTDKSSELYVAADREMLHVMRCFPEIDIEVDYESVFDHYGVSSVRDLSEKIRSIPSFKGIAAPYKLNNQGWFVPDFQSRYFTEDVPYGTMNMQQLARRVKVETSVIDLFVKTIMCHYRSSKISVR